MLSPEWLASLEDVPQRNPESPVYDEALAATPADGDPAAPVGLGAFVFESYTPGNGNSFTAVRNEDYWRGPNGITGEDLPYLDAIEAVVAVDIDSRANGVRSGQFDVMHTANADTIAQFLEDDSVRDHQHRPLRRDRLHHAQRRRGPETDPEGTNAQQPAAQRALPQGAGPRHRPASASPRSAAPASSTRPTARSRQGSIGYLEDTGYPEYDLALAQEEMDGVPRRDSARTASSSRSTRRTTRSTWRPTR